MTSHGVLQTIDVNSKDIDKSPSRKRARYVSPAKGGWSLNRNDVVLDEIYDCGVGLLESESEDENSLAKENNTMTSTRNSKDIIKEERVSTTSPKNSLTNIALGRLQQMIPKTTEEYFNSTDINYFDRLSDEVILYIFHFLPKRFLTNTAYVCRRWHCLTQDESLWSRMDISNKNLQPGAIGHILSRQVVILRLSQSYIAEPGILPGCRASDSSFKARLSYLDLSMAHVSYSTLIAIFNKCTRLKKLSLEHVPINKDVLNAIAHNKELQILNLSMAEGLEVQGLKCLLPACDTLRELNLAWTCLSPASINYVCNNLPETLGRLNISGCRKHIKDKNILDIVSSCGGLKELDLSDSTGLTGDAVHHLTLLDDLIFLALSRCYMIPYNSLLDLKKIRTLMYLDLHGGFIDAAGLNSIQDSVGPRVNINKFKFSSIARPTVGGKHSSIWNMRVRD